MTARQLAQWAAQLEPTSQDVELADRSLRDTVAVAVAARGHPIVPVTAELSEVGAWAALAHVLDFDDLHLPSTAHISTVCVPVALATGGGARAYLAGAGVMARLGTALGWRHYTAGWHATTTAGAPAAAAAAATALGLDAAGIATAMALAVPAAGGVQRAFGTDAKSLQIGYAAEAGVRAARLARAGAEAEPEALDQWMQLVGGDPQALDLSGPAVPGGLAIKLFPACYALQRPIGALRRAELAPVSPEDVESITLTTPAGTVQPLIHHDPRTGLEAKFSLEYAAATSLLDAHQGFAAFSDEAVARPDARRLMGLTRVQLTKGGDGLLDGAVEVEVLLRGGTVVRTTLDHPPGSPGRPPTPEELSAKWADCLHGSGLAPDELTWDAAADLLRTALPRHRPPYP